MSSHGSKRAEMHPYLNPSNWINPEWHYWEKSMYSEEFKTSCREWVRYLQQNTRSLAAIDKTLK